MPKKTSTNTTNTAVKVISLEKSLDWRSLLPHSPRSCLRPPSKPLVHFGKSTDKYTIKKPFEKEKFNFVPLFWFELF